MHRICLAATFFAILLTSTVLPAADRVVATTSEFAAALASATSGDQILLLPGTYGGGHFRAGLNQVVIRSADPSNRAVIDGGGTAIQLSDAQQVTIADLILRNQSNNGLNIDDGGTYDTPSHHITLRNLRVEDIAAPGNRDGIKLSGVDDFLVEKVEVFNWGTGGSAVDMVGCHRGLIQNSHFRHTNTANGGTTLQPKGGCKDITFRANRLDLPRGAGRAIQAGGSTGTPYFRFVTGDSNYEADRIVAEGNVIIGGSSAFSWVNIDGGIFHHNAVYRPGDWIARILNENAGTDIVDTQGGRFLDNQITYNDVSTELRTHVNIGDETLPETFEFARNHWLNLANPTPAGSTPILPVTEVDGQYGGDSPVDPDSPITWQLPWGLWIVNATPTAQQSQIADFASFRRAVPTEEARFDPLAENPLAGSWSTMPLDTSAIDLAPFSQLILVDPTACPECLGVVGDYDASGVVDSADYETWRTTFGQSGPVADGNGDGRVDAADYTIWRDAFVQNAALVGAPFALSVPEPTAWVIAACCAITLNPRSMLSIAPSAPLSRSGK